MLVLYVFISCLVYFVGGESINSLVDYVTIEKGDTSATQILSALTILKDSKTVAEVQKIMNDHSYIKEMEDFKQNSRYLYVAEITKQIFNDPLRAIELFNYIGTQATNKFNSNIDDIVALWENIILPEVLRDNLRVPSYVRKVFYTDFAFSPLLFAYCTTVYNTSFLQEENEYIQDVL